MSSTKASALTGTLIGGGVGTIIGIPAGNPAGGLILGAVAGGAAGALIGNEYDEEDEEIQRQKERQRRHNEEIKSNRKRIDDLKKNRDAANTPTPAPRSHTQAAANEFRPNPSAKPVSETSTSRGRLREEPLETAVLPPKKTLNEEALITSQKKATEEKNSASSMLPPPKEVQQESKPNEKELAKLQEPKVVEDVVEPEQDVKLEADKIVPPPVVEKRAERPRETEVVAEKQQSSAAPASSGVGTKVTGVVDCQKGEEEAKRAQASVSEADKLFYFRRAIRLCPRDASYRVEIGKIYGSLERTDDAEYEFKQALEIDPKNAEAKQQLSVLKGDASKEKSN